MVDVTRLVQGRGCWCEYVDNDASVHVFGNRMTYLLSLLCSPGFGLRAPLTARQIRYLPNVHNYTSIDGAAAGGGSGGGGGVLLDPSYYAFDSECNDKHDGVKCAAFVAKGFCITDPGKHQLQNGEIFKILTKSNS